MKAQTATGCGAKYLQKPDPEFWEVKNGNKAKTFSTWSRSRSGLILIGLAAVAALFLWTRHRDHLLGALPYLIFLLCPLMHLFHGGHGNHHGAENERNEHH